jgi:hypothetical protein
MVPKLNQARLVRMQFQSELLQAVLPFLEKPLRFLPMFESHDDIIRITDDYDVADSTMFSPVPDPLIKRHNAGRCWPAAVRLPPLAGPLRGPYLRLRPLPFLGYTGPQPFPDQAQYPSVGDAMLDEFDQPFVR